MITTNVDVQITEWKPLVSIIIPVFNVEKYLSRCLDSILSQTFRDWECILVDDGSNDKSGAVCDEYAEIEKRIRVIHKENGGPGSARNVGIRNARTDWITFIDGDDFVTRSYLSSLINYCPLRGDTFYTSGMKIIFSDGRSEIMFKYPDMQIDIKDFQEIRSYRIISNGCPCAKLFNRPLIYEHRIFFNEDISLNEDHEFVMRYLGKISYIRTISAINYHYWIDEWGGSLTHVKHSFEKHLQTAVLMHNVIQALCSVWGCKVGDIVSSDEIYIFGAQQIHRASYAVLKMTHPICLLASLSDYVESLKIDYSCLEGDRRRVIFLLYKQYLHALYVYLIIHSIFDCLYNNIRKCKMTGIHENII